MKAHAHFFYLQISCRKNYPNCFSSCFHFQSPKPCPLFSGMYLSSPSPLLALFFCLKFWAPYFRRHFTALTYRTAQVSPETARDPLTDSALQFNSGSGPWLFEVFVGPEFFFGKSCLSIHPYDAGPSGPHSSASNTKRGGSGNSDCKKFVWKNFVDRILRNSFYF